MLKRYPSILVLAIAFLLVDCSAHFLNAGKTSYVPKMKYNISICAIFKDEAKFLKEWIEYHRLIGIEHFYLYDNCSKDYYLKVLTPYIRKGIVTLVHWPLGNFREDNDTSWALSAQTTAYENVIKMRAVDETNWLIFVNVDEFLVPVHENSLNELVETYYDKPGIILSSNCFNVDQHEEKPNSNLLIQSFKFAHPPTPVVEKEVTKILFKPSFCEGFTWPPYQCKFKSGQKPIRVSKNELRINHYVNRSNDLPPIHPIKEKIYLDHRMLSEDVTLELLHEGYEIEDHERTIEKYVPKLLQKMGFSQYGQSSNLDNES